MDARTTPTPSKPSPSSQLDALETTPQDGAPPWLLGTGPLPAILLPAADPPATDTDVLFRHSGWAPRRRCVSQALASLDGAAHRAARFDSCGSHAWVLRSLEDPGRYRIACNTCRDRFCSPCANSRARRVANAVGIYAVDRELRLVTLTLRQSGSTLKQDIDRLYSSFASLRRRKEWSESQRGGVYFCEIKRRSTDEGWHTHLHVLTEGVWLDKNWLSRAWRKITGDSFIVDIRPCFNPSLAARYVAKYASKGVHGSFYHDPLALREALLAIKGRRLVGKYGSWSELDFGTTEAAEEWEPVDSLRRLILRSESGEELAATILEILGRSEPTCSGRSPPPSPGESF